MPDIAKKTKALGGKDVVFSFTRDPNVFWYRELVPITKKYKYKVIEGVNTNENPSQWSGKVKSVGQDHIDIIKFHKI